MKINEDPTAPSYQVQCYHGSFGRRNEGPEIITVPNRVFYNIPFQDDNQLRALQLPTLQLFFFQTLK